jgi:hypothetical protein
MPKLPSYQDVANVAPARDPGVSAPIAAFQSGAGAFAGELAPGIGAVAAVVREEEHRIDNATVNDARRELLDFETEQNDWLSKQKGENVFEAKSKLDKAVTERTAQINKRLKNDRQRLAFREVEGNWRVGLNRSSSHYIAAEMDNHYDSVDSKLVEASSRAAQKAAGTGDFDRVQQEWEDQEKVMAGLAERKGMDATQRKAMLDGRKSNFHSGIALQLIADANDSSAQKYLDANKSEFDADDSLKIQNLLQSRKSEQASEYRVSVADKMQDIEAMGTRGVIPPKNFISDREIEAAYPKSPERVDQLKRRRDESVRFAVGAASLYQRGNEDLIKFVTDTNAPSTARPENFAEEVRHQDLLKAQAAKVLKERIDTPIEYAADHGVGSINPINFSDSGSVSTEIPNRFLAAKSMADQFGSPMKLLTKSESENLSTTLKQASPKQKSALFGNLYNSSGQNIQAYRSVMAQIAPDDPVTAMAGVEANRNPSLSNQILRGQAILIPNKKTDGSPSGGSLITMPSEKDMRFQFDNLTRDAFVGMGDTVRSNFYQAARAVYASTSMDSGDKDMSELKGSRWEEAIISVTGPVEKYNGKRTILPQGYDKSRFKEEVRRQIKQIEADGLLAKGMDFGRVDDMPLQPFGDGRYVFVSGDSHLGDKNGKRIVIDLNKNMDDK